MQTNLQRIGRTIGYGLFALVPTILAGGVWSGLLLTNLKTTAAIPWCVPIMGVILWAAWRYMGGKWGPRSTSEARRRALRAEPVSRSVYAWSFVAGSLGVVALAGLWIVLFQLVKMPPNKIPDGSGYPILTMALAIVMGSLVSPFMEEAMFRGYCQGALERDFRAPAAIAISSFFFALGHVNHGVLWPKLLVYFLAGVLFGAIARITRSILPGIPVHMFGDMVFFIFVWQFDAARRQVWDTGADAWFWLHVAQAIGFAALSILAFRKLATLETRALRTAAQNLGQPGMVILPGQI